MTENQRLRRAVIFAGYLAWFIVLVHVMFLSTGNPYTSPGEILGSLVGLAFWLLVLSLIPYFMARARAKKSGGNVSWQYVMTGVTLIALVLSVGGFYGRLHTTKSAVAPATADRSSEPQEHQAAPQPTLASQTPPTVQEAPAPQSTALKFQCSGSYTQHTNGTSQEFALAGVSVEIGDSYIDISGANVFDGTLAIINRLENGIGFQSPRDETISGFFNRFTGQLSLLDRLGPKNADGSFQLSANSALNCQNAHPMF